jgi:taurine transport system substrate-binding protein
LGALAVLAVALTLAGHAAAQVPGKKYPATLRYGNVVYDQTSYVGIAKGYFDEELKKYGVKLKSTDFEGGRVVTAAMVAGELDLGLCGALPCLSALMQGLQARAIWIPVDELTIEGLIVRKDSGIKGPKDLVGKKLAAQFNSTSHYALLGYLKTHGVDPKKVTIIDIRTMDQVAALTRGDIDGGYLWNPHKAKAIKELGAINLVNIVDQWKDGYRIADLILVRNEFAERYPELVEALLRGWERANQLWKSNPEEAARAAYKLLGYDTWQDCLEALKGGIYPTAKEHISPDYFGTTAKKGFMVPFLKSVAQFMVEHKLADKLPPDAFFDRIVDPSFAEKIAK